MDGSELRDAGIEKALSAEDEQWKVSHDSICDKVFAEFPVGYFFTSEDLRNPVTAQIGEPHHPGVWGGIFRRYIKHLKDSKAVEDAGFAVTARATSHRRPTRRYRKLK